MSSPSGLSFSVTGLAAWLVLWDLSSLTRNRAQAPAVKARRPNCCNVKISQSRRLLFILATQV